MKKKLNKNDYIFRGLENKVLKKNPGEIAGQSFLLKNLKGCKIYLCDYISQIYIQNCSNCEIYTGPVESSIFMRKSHNNKLTTAGQQIRISDSTNINSYIFSLTDLTLENSSGITIAPYNFAYKGLKSHFEKIGLDFMKDNLAFRIYDFTPKENNFEILDFKNFGGNFFFDGDEFVSDFDGNENPVGFPVYFGGEVDFDVFQKKEVVEEDDDGMMCFDIKVGMEKAKEDFDKKKNCLENENNFKEKKNKIDFEEKKNNLENEIDFDEKKNDLENEIDFDKKKNDLENFNNEINLENDKFGNKENISNNEKVIFKKSLKKKISKKKNSFENSVKENKMDLLRADFNLREKEILEKLLLKKKKEQKEKKLRKEKGKKELEEFLENFKNLKKEKKTKNENFEKNLKENIWENVKDNISFKISENNHKGDLTVFKRVINNVFEQGKN